MYMNIADTNPIAGIAVNIGVAKYSSVSIFAIDFINLIATEV